jgi:glycerol-3-phosphate dehydrogenase (NAD(P)+)
MSQKVTIIGDGQMALVMADALVERGAAVRMWGPIAADAQALAQTHVSPRLPGFHLPAEVEVTADEAAALADAEFIVSAIPTQYLRHVWQRLAKHVRLSAEIVSVTKGIETSTALRPTQVVRESLGEDFDGCLCALSGPSIAAELARRLPASLVAASADHRCSRAVQDLLNVPWLRIYRHDDVIGVEFAGATKNIIAMAAGMIDGLGAGDNAKSALLARGLAEIARLGAAMGAKIDTFFGVAGVGDLATTCFSPQGRNRTCGERLGRGESLQSILDSMKSVVEGVPTTRAVMQLAKARGIDMPITAAVHAILFEGLSPKQAIRDLMSRELKAEQVG